MSQPPKFTRNYDFADFQSSNPTTPLPADQVESELNEIKASTDAIIDNLALIQRDDGALANASVHVAALSTAVKNLLLLSSVSIRGEWAAATLYAIGDVVINDNTPYLCYVAHTSGVSIDNTKFSAITAPLATPDDQTDDDKFLRASGGAGTWVDLTAAMITDIVAGLQSVITAADVGAARTALGITAAGDAIATAASAAAQRTALGASTIGGTIFTAANEAAVITALAVPTLAAANVFTADQTLRNADAGATEGPLLILDRNSASPADNDLVGAIEFRGRSDLPSTRTMAKILAQVLDVSDAEEDAILALQSVVAGSLTTKAYIGGGLVVGAPTGGDQGAGSINAESVLVDGAPISGSGGVWSEIVEGTFSSTAVLDLVFTPAEWRAIKVVLTNIQPATDGSSLIMLTSTNAGSAYDNGATDYAWTQIQSVLNTTPSLSASGDNQDQFISFFPQGNGATERADFEITLYDPAAALPKRVVFAGQYVSTGASAIYQQGSGLRHASADVDAFRIQYSSGNIAAGTYKILGLTE